MAISTDYLVIGSGVAGLTFALRAAEHGDVLVVTKRSLDDSSTARAQGGVAAVLSERDSFEQHIKDTLEAGAGLCHGIVVDVCVREGPAAVRWLKNLGLALSQKDDGELDLGREGGHSQRRVAHAGDITGREIETVLASAVRQNPRIRVLEWHMAIDLVTRTRYGKSDQCVGAYVLDERGARVQTVLARATVLATGGAGKVYLYTSNPDVATGDGVAMAYRAGAEVANMEFYQFHPTVVFDPRAKNFLISEALRGEGAVLRLQSGEAFMREHHPLGDLAPRDVVARAIDYEMKRSGSEYVVLDITHKPRSFIEARFPNISAECKKYGYDLAAAPIPVVPAAHFMCGGVTTDMRGRTSLSGLWAVGETACTGLHGANRLASNSLLEGLVLAARAAEKVAEKIADLRTVSFPDVPEWEIGSAVPSDEAVIVSHNWDELRRLMWNYVGILRSDARLRRAATRILLLQDEIREYYWKHLVTRDLLELRNIATVAELIVSSAVARRESRGLHFNIDCPAAVPELATDTVAKRGVLPHLRGRG
ncbi:MAG: L-aspartate oxidase [Polyangiaceae bacterium]|nr:L-aspartate oxidase [Polyangiaceae bacterium]